MNFATAQRICNLNATEIRAVFQQSGYYNIIVERIAAADIREDYVIFTVDLRDDSSFEEPDDRLGVKLYVSVNEKGQLVGEF